MNKTRRYLTVVVLAITCAVSISACGAGAVGGLGLSALGHTKWAHRHERDMNAIRCAWHGYRTVHDFKHGHKVYGTVQGALAAHSCLKVVKK